MENKSYGEILYEAILEANIKFNGGYNTVSWEIYPSKEKEYFEYAGNKLIQYYEDYILEKFLNKHREDDSK